MKSEFKARLATPVQLIGETARAIGFLSRIPVPSRFFAEEDRPLSEAVRAFPLAGLAVALPSAILLAILSAAASPALMTGFLVVALQIAVTGGLHEDGLADTADGHGAGGERERILAAMKDSRIGTFGTIALILSIGIRAVAVATIAAAATPFAAMFAYLGIAAASRATMVWHWQALPAARADGVAASAGRPHETATNWAIAIGVGLFVLCLVPALGVLPGSAVLIAMAAATAAFTRHVDVKIAGHTGDTIGAAQQVAEIVGLVALVLFL